MSESDVELAELRFLEAHLQHRARICYAMVAAGMVCLVAGVVMLIVGLTGDQVVWVRTGNLKITTGGGCSHHAGKRGMGVCCLSISTGDRLFQSFTWHDTWPARTSFRDP